MGEAYGVSRVPGVSYDQTVDKATAALKAESAGLLGEIGAEPAPENSPTAEFCLSLQQRRLRLTAIVVTS